jgi:hypothetical protein
MFLVQESETFLKQFKTSFEQRIKFAKRDAAWVKVTGAKVFKLCLTIQNLF